jgi:CelD/BcsL family acetyltransferase involved in cellulose biosynthesis
VTLPHTVEEYMASLGKSTRSYVYRYLNRLRRHFPSCCHQVYTKHEIGEQHIHDIIRLNKIRMAHKGKASVIGHEETQRIIRLARECGLVSVVTIDGRICAGTINYTVGRNSFLEVVAHDPGYNDYRLGTLCCYLTVCECIARGSEEYHFLWGKNEYKYRLRGVQRNLSNLSIYRSRLQFLLNGGMALRIAVNGYIHSAKLWLLDKARRQNSLVSRLAFHALNSLRNLKQFAAGSLARTK